MKAHPEHTLADCLAAITVAHVLGATIELPAGLIIWKLHLTIDDTHYDIPYDVGYFTSETAARTAAAAWVVNHWDTTRSGPYHMQHYRETGHRGVNSERLTELRTGYLDAHTTDDILEQHFPTSNTPRRGDRMHIIPITLA